MRSDLAMFLCAAALLPAQAPPIIRVPPFPAAIQQYLELTPDQVNAITRLNASLAQLQADKSRRSVQVQIEIGQETAKPTLDALALGMRYLELEAIRRELAAQQQKTYSDIQNVLTAAQKTKVQALVEAMRLQSITCEAQMVNILPPLAFGRVIPNAVPVGGEQGFASFLLGGGVLSPVPQFSNCSPGIRTGDFIFTPGTPDQPQP